MTLVRQQTPAAFHFPCVYEYKLTENLVFVLGRTDFDDVRRGWVQRAQCFANGAHRLSRETELRVPDGNEERDRVEFQPDPSGEGRRGVSIDFETWCRQGDLWIERACYGVQRDLFSEKENARDHFCIQRSRFNGSRTSIFSDLMSSGIAVVLRSLERAVEEIRTVWHDVVFGADDTHAVVDRDGVLDLFLLAYSYS